MIFFTSICANYLPKAMTLAESVKRHCADAKFVLCLVERDVPEVAASCEHFDEVVLAKNAGWDNFDRFMFRHAIVEASTAVKAQFMLYLLERFPAESKFVYLDPDVLVYSELEELDQLLDHQSVVLCPHLLRPGNIDMEISSLAHGCYNLGFLGISRAPNSHAFLTWWAERLFQFCYDDINRGIFTDQRWIDLAPCFFDVSVLKHHGYDFATWSLLNSDLRQEGNAYQVNGDPLRFIHFSGLDSGTIDKAIGWWLTDNNRETFVKLYNEYKQLLIEHGQETLGKLPWTYANYSDGRKISNEARVAYRARELWDAVPSPFGSSDRNILSLANPAGTELAQAQQPVGADPASPPSVLDRVTASVRAVGVGPTMRKAIRKVTRAKASK
ncbi:MAG: hypothetical protein ABS82_10760 [Rhodanobacter sp. SCN 67-45]|nr:MAG: hypothetical protein ABS82_10760 [Rhodanobacter sp. SCN 67-45]